MNLKSSKRLNFFSGRFIWECLIHVYRAIDTFSLWYLYVVLMVLFLNPLSIAVGVSFPSLPIAYVIRYSLSTVWLCVCMCAVRPCTCANIGALSYTSLFFCVFPRVATGSDPLTFLTYLKLNVIPCKWYFQPPSRYLICFVVLSTLLQM